MMTNIKHISPGKETTKSQMRKTGTRLKAEIDEDRGSPVFPTVSDTCSYSAATDSVQYDGESLDFGDDDVDFI